MNVNEKPTQLPKDYIHITEGCAVHLSTIKRFTEDVTAFLDYLDIATDYPSLDNPEALKEFTIRCSAHTLEVAERMQEHGNLMQAVVQFLKGCLWLDGQPQPLFEISRKQAKRQAGKGTNRTKRTGQQPYKTKEWERVMRSWWMPRTWPDCLVAATTGPSGK